MSEQDDDLLKQQDLSQLRLQEMSMAERAELVRRYEAFVQHFGAPAAPPEPKRKIRKWVPGKTTTEKKTADKTGPNKPDAVTE
jgi:hypothetical protein